MRAHLDKTLPLAILKAAHAKGYARVINVFATSAALPGDHILLGYRSLPSVYQAKRLTITGMNGEHIKYVVMREPVTCQWVGIDVTEGARDPEMSLDVFDLLWSACAVADSRDELLTTLLLMHGFLSPEIVGTRMATRARWAVRTAWKRKTDLFLTPGTFETRICDGCDDCDNGDLFHRIANEYEPD